MFPLLLPIQSFWEKDGLLSCYCVYSYLWKWRLLVSERSQLHKFGGFWTRTATCLPTSNWGENMEHLCRLSRRLFTIQCHDNWHAMCDVCLTLTVMRLRTFCHFFCHSYSASVTVQCRAMITCKFRVAHTISASNKRLLQFIWSLVIRPTYFAKPKAIFVFTITSDVRGMSIATT